MRIEVRVTVGGFTIGEPVAACDVDRPQEANRVFAARLRELADEIEATGSYDRLVADIEAMH